MNPKNTARAIKGFVYRHRVAVAVVATSAVWIAINVSNSNALDEFLKEHNLSDEYWNIEE